MYRATPEGARRARSAQLMYRYGITIEQFEELLDAQGGRCAICGDGNERLHVDHCHTTGRIRGLLCGKCNRGLGLLRDNPDILERGAEYLRQDVVS